MLKKILLGLLIICNGNILNTLNASEDNSIDNEEYSFLSKYVDQLNSIINIYNTNISIQKHNLVFNKIHKSIIDDIMEIIKTLQNIKDNNNITLNNVANIIDWDKVFDYDFDKLITKVCEYEDLGKEVNKLKEEEKLYTTIIDEAYAIIPEIIEIMLSKIDDDTFNTLIMALCHNINEIENPYNTIGLYEDIEIDSNKKINFPTNHCKTLYDVILAYDAYSKIQEIALKKQSNFQDTHILYIYDEYFNDNKKQILNDILRVINNKYNTKYGLYTVPGFSEDDNKPIQWLLISQIWGTVIEKPLFYDCIIETTFTENIKNLVNQSISTIQNDEKIIILKEQDNERLIKLYANRPHYVSHGSYRKDLFKSMYDVVIAHFIDSALNKIVTKMQRRTSQNNNNIIDRLKSIPSYSFYKKESIIIEFPKNTNEIIEHLKPIIRYLLNYDKAGYYFTVDGNKLVIERKNES